MSFEKCASSRGKTVKIEEQSLSAWLSDIESVSLSKLELIDQQLQLLTAKAKAF